MKPIARNLLSEFDECANEPEVITPKWIGQLLGPFQSEYRHIHFIKHVYMPKLKDFGAIYSNGYPDDFALRVGVLNNETKFVYRKFLYINDIAHLNSMDRRSIGRPDFKPSRLHLIAPYIFSR